MTQVHAYVVICMSELYLVLCNYALLPFSPIQAVPISMVASMSTQMTCLH